MRFAWRRRNRPAGSGPVKPGFTHPFNLVMVAYNVVWWVPLVLPLTGNMSYHDGFVGFLVVTTVRLAANAVRNNLLDERRAEYFPLRSP
ncbi:MAG: hypothetical protein AB7K09_02565 [Planctomycetota bacterium]